MSAPTKGQLQAMNEKLQATNRQLEKMAAETLSLSKRLRNDLEEVEMAAAHYKRQRDQLVGFLQGYRKDIEEATESTPVYQTPSVKISRVDAFLGECREDPPIRDGVQRRIS